MYEMRVISAIEEVMNWDMDTAAAIGCVHAMAALRYQG